MTPAELSAAARDVISRPDEATKGLWPRAAALLGRQALELGLKEFWSRRAPAVANLSGRARLVCLPSYLGDRAVAGDAAYAWAALSQACHHRGYELGPTEGELRGLLDLVEAVLRRLER